MSKEALVIILDIGKSMGNLRENGGMTGLDKAKAAFRLMIQQKLLFGYKQDVCSVILLNSVKTKNACNDKYGGYESIEEYFELGSYTLDLLECIDNVQCNKSGTNGDALDSLLVAAQIIINFCGKKKYRKRIFMITDGNTPINDIDQIKDIADSFMESNIAFNCIGIGFGEEKERDNDNDNDDNDNEGYNSFNDVEIYYNQNEKPTQIQTKNEKILRYFSSMVGGRIFTASSAIAMMSELRSKSVLLRPTYSGPLKITSKLAINIKIYCRCRQQTLPSLKKESQIGNESKKVMMDRLYLNKFRNNDDDEEVEEDERVKSYLYGKEMIPFNENDEIRLNYKSGEKHFECLAFTDSKNIQRHKFMHSSFVVTPDPKSQRSQYSLSAFIRACHEKEVSLLCRLVARKNASPKYVCLQPRIKSNKEIFILNELPFTEDIRNFPFASFNVKKAYIPNREQVEVCKNLIKSLNLMEAQLDEDGDKIEALRPQNTFNPILQRFYQSLQNRALDPNAEIQALDPMILKYLEPDPMVFNDENTQNCMRQFENLFPTKLIPKKQVKKERKHWNDMDDELDNLFDVGGGGDDNNNDNNKNIKDEEEEKEDDDDDDVDVYDAIGLLGIEMEIVREIGTTTPKNDFDKLLSARSSADLFEQLSIKYWAIIHKLIDKSFGERDFNKALECIIHLKQCSIKEEEPLLFNTELIKFKAKWKEKKPNLWAMVIQKDIKLICMNDFEKDQVPDGLKVTKVECDQFLTQQIEEKQIIAKIEDDSDDSYDDLL